MINGNSDPKTTPAAADPLRTWEFGGRAHRLGEFPWMMGIVNSTPDSFSDGGRYLDVAAAVEQGHRLLAEGADILDVGGESTRPGAAPVAEEEELQRVLPVVERLAAETGALISIDTTKAEVARRALAAGASIVNDISGLRFDAEMPAVCAGSDAGVICMHIQGTPQTMQNKPTYDDVVSELCVYFDERLDRLEQAGIDRRRIVLDPGIGFGKSARHNLEILSAIERFRRAGRPVLVGHSRKRFLSRLLNRAVDEPTSGTIGVAIALAAQHTDIIRVHDVRAVRDAITAWKAIADRIEDSASGPGGVIS